MSAETPFFSGKHAKIRTTLGALSIFLTLFGLTGCPAVQNDLRSQKIPGADIAYQPQLNVGASAHELLSSEHLKGLLVEVQYVDGFLPTQEARNHLLELLQARLDKPAGINIVLDDPIPSPHKDSYNIQDVRALEDRYRRFFTSKDQAVVYLLYLDARSSDDAGEFKTLGQAYRNTSAVIYANTIHGLPGVGVNQPRWISEYLVTAHELGHILGLVNLGSSMQTPHLEKGQGSHCDNPKCLMNHQIETSDLGGAAINPADLPGFDENCLADLRKNGGK